MNTVIWIISGIAGVSVLALTFRMFFREEGDFGDAVGHVFTPDIFSALNGEYWEDRWNTFKMFLWLALGAGAFFAARTISAVPSGPRKTHRRPRPARGTF